MHWEIWIRHSWCTVFVLSAQFYPDGGAVDLLSPHREDLKHVTHPVLGRCTHIIWTKTWANWQFLQFFYNMIYFPPTPLCPVLLKAYRRCVWVQQKKPLHSMKHIGRRLRRTPAPFTAGGSKIPWPCHSVTSFDEFQHWIPGEITIVMRRAAFRCSLYLRINGQSLMLPLNIFFLSLQFHVLCVCGVETSSRGGGFGGLPQQTAAVQPGRSSQQGRPQRVSRVPAFSSPSLKLIN